MKKPMPNIFNCTVFKKHISFLLDENQNNAKFSNLFMYLPSTLDGREDFMHYKYHVNLHPINITFDDLKQAADQKIMDPSFLSSNNRSEVTDAYYKIMRKIVVVSNQNLVRSSDVFISNGGKVDPDRKISWIDDFYKLNTEKFQLTY